MNLSRLHIYAVSVFEDAESRGMEIVSAEDLDLLQGLTDALSKDPALNNCGVMTD